MCVERENIALFVRTILLPIDYTIAQFSAIALSRLQIELFKKKN